MAGMWIAHVDVKDAETYAEYIKGASQVIPRYDGVFIARGGRYRQMEGKEFGRNVVIRFPSYERALECYESEEYQVIAVRAKDSSVRSLVVLEID